MSQQQQNLGQTGQQGLGTTGTTMGATGLGTDGTHMQGGMGGMKTMGMGPSGTGAGLGGTQQGQLGGQQQHTGGGLQQGQMQGYQGGGQGGQGGQYGQGGQDPYSSLFSDPFSVMGVGPMGMGMGMGMGMMDPWSLPQRMLGGAGMGGAGAGGADALGFPRMGLGSDLLAGPLAGLSLGGRAGGGLMKMDIKENAREYVITADVPGVNKDNIKLEVDNNNVLHVSTTRRDEREDRGERGGWTYHRVERASGASYRSLKLPQGADAARVVANCDNGVLTISVPKLEGGAAGPQRKQISVA